jgi:hypothetical protein
VASGHGTGLAGHHHRRTGRRHCPILPDNPNTIAAGVALFRLMQWALPIPIGWFFTLRWRRKVSSGKLPDPFAPGGMATDEASA